MEDTRYINIFNLDIHTEEIDISTIRLLMEKNIEKWIIKNNKYPIFFQISDFFLNIKNNYINIKKRNSLIKILNSKIENNKIINKYTREYNLLQDDSIQIKFEKKNISFFFLNSLLDTKDIQLEFINNRKCSIIGPTSFID